MPVKDALLHKLQQLRRDVHQHPEVSGEEEETAKRIKNFIHEFGPDDVVSGIGGHGIVFFFKGTSPGPMVMIRSELDGLPIKEFNDLPYRSEYEGKGHLCGHDGHMTIVAGLAGLLAEQRPRRGTVALMFQPAEETGAGAAAMLEDKAFSEVRPDYIFALHNLPGFSKKEIIIRKNVFAAASKGIIMKLEGKTSHAAEPENGVSPSMAVAEMIKVIETAKGEAKDVKNFALATVVHTRIGERAFGTTPGEAVVMATLRAFHDEDLKTLEKHITTRCKQAAEQCGLKFSLEETEVFHSTRNDSACVELIEQVASELELSITQTEQPFRWSEDFGLFTQNYKGAMFGLGAGEDTPDLHNPNYNFPEDIIEAGLLMFYNIIDQLLNKDNA